jgi:gluconolactonase
VGEAVTRWAAAWVLTIAAQGCGGETAASATGSGSGAGASGGATSSTTTAGGGGDVGGSGGSYEGVDPIAGIDAVELVAGGFSFTEGTVWLAALGVLRFSDIPASRIHELDPRTDAITVWRDPSGSTNGNGVAPDGDMVMCEHTGRRVSRSPAAGMPMPVSVADTYQGMSFNSPNDVIVRSDGVVYFTDPTYGLVGPQEIPFQGVFRVATGGAVTLVDDAFGQPNGIALSPDEGKLFVSDSQDGGVYAYDVGADGSTGARSLLVAIGPSDGMAVDDAGNLYFTTGAGVEVYKDDGTSWGTIAVPEQPANCAFGGADRRTLYITAQTSLYRVTLNVPGKP